MDLPKIIVQSSTLSELLNEMGKGKLQVPRFQRRFVWPVTKTRALLDSMYKEFPIGTFFLWRAPAGGPPLSRPLSELGIPAPKKGAELSYILDGQQRLTSLYVVIKGLVFNQYDYGQVCIDLETATRYEQSTEEGFEDHIFVYRKPDARQFIAVKDLIGPKHMTIFEDIPKEWKPAFIKAHNLVQTYPFSVVKIQEQSLGDAIEIFQRINQGGRRLSRYDLVCANVWREDFDFRRRVGELNDQFARKGFGKLHETIYTQTFALLTKDACTTAVELSLKTDEIVKVWNSVIKAIRLAVDFSVNSLGVKRSEYLPYRGILVVLAYYFYHAPSSALSLAERGTLWNWFWRVTLSERYSHTSPSRMAEDAHKLRELINGEDVVFEYPAKVTADAVARTRMTSTSSALRNAVICMLALRQPKNLKDGSLVNLADDFFSDLKKAERHHIFPVSYLRKRGWSPLSVHLVPNFCFVPADLNKEISSRAPKEYLDEYRTSNSLFDEAAGSHLLPVQEGAAIWKNEFDGFISERSKLIADELSRLLIGRPDEIVEVEASDLEGELAGEVSRLEARLRDFIDNRMFAILGSDYWRKSVPGDVISEVDKRVRERLSRHPYEDPTQYASGRSKLDFCDVSHYEKIILKNWDHFKDSLGRKDYFQQHISNFRTLRNCVKHGREPTDIEQGSGAVAIKWLDRVLDKHDEEIADYIEEDIVGDADEVITREAIQR